MDKELLADTETSAETQQIRRTTIADVDCLASIDVGVRGGQAAARRDRILALLGNSARTLWTVDVGRRIAGYAVVAELHPGPDDAAPSGFYLGGVTLDPEFRRRGVAGHLTGRRMAWIGNHADEAWYFTNAGNLASLKLHQAFGFVEVARGPEFAGVSFDGGEGILLHATTTPSSPLASSGGDW